MDPDNAYHRRTASSKHQISSIHLDDIKELGTKEANFISLNASGVTFSEALLSPNETFMSEK